MYDIRQFIPALYVVLFLGFTGFAISDENPQLWIFATFFLTLNAWLVGTGRFVPLPRWLANAVTVAIFVYIVAVFVSRRPAMPQILVGQFLILLQLVKLFEQRGNRDYAQLLVLSLLLMLASSVSTASLLYGLVLIIYLVLSLYCCLLYHMKVEADRARASFIIPSDKISASTLRQDQRFMGRSMRRVTALLFLVSLLTAVTVFVFFPRGAGQGLFGPFQFRQNTSLTGFSERVSFDQINRIKQNEEVVAHVKVWQNDVPVLGSVALQMRGLTLDVYGTGAGESLRPHWTRSHDRIYEEREYRPGIVPAGPLHAAPVRWRQRVFLRPTGLRYLFALQGISHHSSAYGSSVALSPSRDLTVRYSPFDQSLQTEAVVQPLEYEIVSTNGPAPASPFHDHRRVSGSSPDILEQVRAYTLTPEVLGDMSSQWPRAQPVDEGNEEVARRIEQHLKNNFSYTLDLTTERSSFERGDPVVSFLTRAKKGHCEYFASAMALMCQSIGVPARMVVGFRCDEFNSVGGYYIVRQSHAHAWVEVLTPRGWVAYDPTSARQIPVRRTAGLWGSIKHFFDFLEVKWAEHVVAFDNRGRDRLLVLLEPGLPNRVSAFFRRLWEMTDSVGFWRVSLNLISLLMTLMVLGLITAIAGFLLQQRRLRRRAARIGLDHLPMDQRLRLARQLAFYDRLTRILHRHNITRPPHLTPLEFSESLVHLPGSAFDTIRRLTALLYKIRFGGARLAPAQQRRLERTVSRLEASLARS